MTTNTERRAQPSLFPTGDGQAAAPTGEQLKQEGIGRIVSSSPADEAKALADAMLYCCSAYLEFTSDQLRDYLDINYPEVSIRPNAIGAAFNCAARAKDITPTGSVQKAMHQKRVLDALREHIEAHGIVPTQRELAETLEVQRTTIANHMAALEDKGYIQRSRKWRSTQVVD